MNKTILEPKDLVKIPNFVEALNELNETPEQHLNRVRNLRNGNKYKEQQCTW